MTHDQAKLDVVRDKIQKCRDRMVEGRTWMQATVINEQGIHVGIDMPVDEELDRLTDEVFAAVGDDDVLCEFMLSESRRHGDADNYAQMREEELGWEPGIIVATPDVPQKDIDRLTGKDLRCHICDWDSAE